MWILLTRAPVADAAYCPGRRWLAIVDAVLWPALLAAAMTRSMPDTGLVGPVGYGLLGFVVWRRLHTAVWLNARYRFTTAKLARALAMSMLVGIALKVGLH